jgi:hypothetical protein
MRIAANGYDKNYGVKEIADCDIEANRAMRATSSPPGVLILVPRVSMKLNGNYLLHVELSEREVSRLFYTTHRDKNLHEMVGIFAEFKHEEDEAAEAEAQREAKRKAAAINRRLP